MNSLVAHDPTRCCLSRWALTVILAITAHAVAADPNSDPAARLAVPDAAAKEQATKMVKSLFAKEYGKHDAIGRRALADKLLSQARAGGDSPAVQFVLLTESRELAILGGDRPQALNAADELVKAFAVPNHEVRQMKLDILGEGGRLAAIPGAVATALSLCEDALKDDDFDQAERAARLAQSKDKVAAVAARTELSRVESARQLHAAAEQATAKLKADPDDAEAKSAIGKYLCFVKGQWAQGLPFLVQSPDPALRDAAKRDAALLAADESDSPGTAVAKADAGDAWWSLSEVRSKPTVIPEDAERRAVFWYRRALPTLTGLRAVQSQKRIEKLRDSTATASYSIHQFARNDGFYSGPPDDFPADQEPARVWIHGQKKTEYGLVAGKENAHLGKGVFMSGDLAAAMNGSVKAGIGFKEDGTDYEAVFVMKDQSVRMQFIPMEAGETRKWNVVRRGNDIVITVEKEGGGAVTLSAPASAVGAFGFVTTVRWVRDKADLTVCFD